MKGDQDSFANILPGCYALVHSFQCLMFAFLFGQRDQENDNLGFIISSKHFMVDRGSSITSTLGEQCGQGSSKGAGLWKIFYRSYVQICIYLNI